MKYTNKRLEQSYAYPKIVFTVFLCLLILGLGLVAWGFADASARLNTRYEFADVFELDGNRADKTASIEIISTPLQVISDKYTTYYLIEDGVEKYIAAMDKITYMNVCEEIEVKGKAYLEGTTLTAIDDNVTTSFYFTPHKGDNIYLSVHKVTYMSILKSRVQFILGAVLAVISLFIVLGMNMELNRFRKITSLSGVTPAEMDKEANSKGTINYSFEVMLTPNYLIGHKLGFAAFKYDEIISVSFCAKGAENPYHRCILKATDGKEYELYRAGYSLDTDELWDMFDELNKRNPGIVTESEIPRTVEDEE